MTSLIGQNFAHFASVFAHALAAGGGLTGLNSSFSSGWATLVEYCS